MLLASGGWDIHITPAGLGTAAVALVLAVVAGFIMWLITGPFRISAAFSDTSRVANVIATIAWPLILIAAGLGAWAGVALMS